MKVLAISDTHGYLPSPPSGEFDVFIHAGDIAPDISLLGNVESAHINFSASQEAISDKQLEWYANEMVPWFDSINAKHKILIPGNHDLATERFLYRFEQIITAAGVDMLLGSALQLNTSSGSLSVYGFPWIVPVGKWAWMATADTRKQLLDQMPDGDLDIIVTHAPPYGVCDEVRNGYHIGVPEMDKEFFAARNVGMVICGHCHEQGGVSQAAYGTNVHNVAYVRDTWQTANFTQFERNQEGKWNKV